MANTRKEVLESNERYRKNFLNKNTRLHLINDYDLIQAIEESDKSFNSLNIRLLREHFKLDSEEYLSELEKGIQQKKDMYRKAIEMYWNEKDDYETNVESLNNYLKLQFKTSIGEDIQSKAILKNELINLGKVNEK